MKRKTFTQKEIVEGLKNGSSKELKYLYFEVKPKVRNYVIKNGGIASDVNDIFQVAILATRIQLLEKNKNIISIENYIFTACVREWLKFNIKKDRELKNLDGYLYGQQTDTESMEDEELSKAKISREFMIAFNALKSDCRKLFKLKISGQETEDIALELDVSEEYVKTKRRRCKRYFMRIYNNLKNNE